MGEALVHRGHPEGAVDLVGAGELGQGDGLGHLLTDPAGAGRGGLHQPGPRSGPDGQELGLRRRTGHRGVVPGHLVRLVAGEVRVVDGRGPGPGHPVPGDLHRPLRTGVHDHHHRVRSGAVMAHEHLGPEQVRGHRVLGVFEGDHRRVLRHLPSHPVGHGVRRGGDPMQRAGLLGEHVVRAAPGHPVLPGVHHGHEPRAGGLELSERGVLVPQVGVLRDQVGLGQLHRVLHPALGGRIRWLAGQHLHAVMPSERHGGLVTHRHPGHMRDRHCLLVIRQHIGRRAPDQPEAPVQGGEHTRSRPITQGDDGPVAGPGQPGHEQHRLGPVDRRPIAEVVLQPCARLGDPGPVHPALPGPPGGLHLGHRPPGGALRAGVAHCGELGVHDIGADPARGGLDPFLDLGQPDIGDLRAAGSGSRGLAGVAGPHQPGHGVMGATGQLGGAPQ
ncbi:Uncharacterised protein [Streptococcus pneumoniae]|nr:Uncharacterised protein [Streptococcus pneumoniae]